jgi:uncharacterized SAM-binding protein YcdF (DUF218 family)
MSIKRVLLYLLTCVAIFGLVGLGIVSEVFLGMKGTATLPSECAIVFGAAVRPTYDDSGTVVGATAGPGITRRVRTAATLYRQGRVQRLIVTGGKGDLAKASEAAIMRELALHEGVPAEDIEVEDQSRSTIENVRFSRPLIDACDSIVGISDGYHLARIRMLAKEQGLDLPTLPAEPAPGLLFQLRSIVREVAAIAYYSVF